MLLPSALPCDPRKYSARSRFAASRLFSPTPPPSDDGFSASSGLLGTCRALQSLLNNVSPSPSPRRTRPERLQSPLHVKPPTRTQPQRVVKRPSTPPRGLNKRRRDSYEDGDTEMADVSPRDQFSTPKRQRCAPLDLPLGLETSDFNSLGSTTIRASSPAPRIPKTEKNGATPDPDTAIPSIEISDCSSNPTSDWTAEDDRKLVELVLEKFQLSKRDWDECARRMGKDNDTVGRRWQALVGEGNVGLRRGRRMVRRPIDENWR